MFSTNLFIYRLFLVVCLMSFQETLKAAEFSHPAVNKIVQSTELPDGVVFELLSWDKNTWQWAAPMISSLRQQLKAKFPSIDVAIVSHGGEQFQLTRDRQQLQPVAIATLSELVDEGVNLHVCGTHSSWQDVAETAYIDIVDVSPSGPAQINDYIKLGYQHILLHKPL